MITKRNLAGAGERISEQRQIAEKLLEILRSGSTARTANQRSSCETTALAVQRALAAVDAGDLKSARSDVWYLAKLLRHSDVLKHAVEIADQHLIAVARRNLGNLFGTEVGNALVLAHGWTTSGLPALAPSAPVQQPRLL